MSIDLRSSRSRATALALAVFALMSAVWLYPMSLEPATMAPDVGDPMHIAYIMSWVSRTLFTAPWNLYDSNSFYPHSRSLAFSEHLLPQSVMVAPVYWITKNPVLIYNVSVFLAFTLSATMMFLLIREVTGSASAGFLAGCVYAFNGFTLSETARVHILHLEWMPLALMFVLRFVRSGRFTHALGACAFGALQCLSCSYFIVYFAMIGPAWLGLAYLGLGRRPSKRDIWRLGVVVTSTALLMILFLLPYMELRRLGTLPQRTIIWGVNLLGHLQPHSTGLLWGHVAPFGTSVFGREFKGFVALLLAGLGCIHCCVRRGAAPVRAIGWIALFTAALGVTFGLGSPAYIGRFSIDPGPYRLFQLLPFTGGLRHAPRINVLVQFGVAILAGLGSAWILARLKRWRMVLVVALAVLLPLEHWRPSPYGVRIPTGKNVPAVYFWIPQHAPGPLADLPLYVKKRMLSMYLHLSTYHRQPIPVGRVSFYPPGHEYLLWLWSFFPDKTSLYVASRMGIKTLVVHPRMWPEDLRQKNLDWLDRQPGLKKLRCFTDRPPEIYDWYGLGGECVYRIVDDETWRRRPCAPYDEIPRASWGMLANAGDDPDLLRDDDLKTSWSTDLAKTQQAHLRVRFRKAEPLAAVALESSANDLFFPRRFDLEVLDAAGWHRVQPEQAMSRWELLSSQLTRRNPRRMVLRIPREVVRGFRFKGMEPSHWTFSELRAYRDCRPVD